MQLQLVDCNTLPAYIQQRYPFRAAFHLELQAAFHVGWLAVALSV